MRRKGCKNSQAGICWNMVNSWFVTADQILKHTLVLFFLFLTRCSCFGQNPRTAVIHWNVATAPNETSRTYFFGWMSWVRGRSKSASHALACFDFRTQFTCIRVRKSRYRQMKNRIPTANPESFPPSWEPQNCLVFNAIVTMYWNVLQTKSSDEDALILWHWMPISWHDRQSTNRLVHHTCKEAFKVPWRMRKRLDFLDLNRTISQASLTLMDLLGSAKGQYGRTVEKREKEAWAS
jgi:hypothetical protein